MHLKSAKLFMWAKSNIILSYNLDQKKTFLVVYQLKPNPQEAEFI